VTVELGVPVKRREARALDAVVFVFGTVPGLMVAGTLALCTVMSFLDFGMEYERKAFIGAGLAVAASVVSELVFGAYVRQRATWQAYRARAAARGVGAIGGALFASGGLGALELSSSARATMLLAIVWIAIGPVLADVIDAYGLAPYDGARRAQAGALALRAILGAAAVCGLALYGLAQLLPGEWWMLAIPLIAVAFAGCAYLLAHAGYGRRAG
jgi:hypothetical protein